MHRVEPELVEAFERLIGDAPKRDPGCKALIAIARALVQMDDPAAKVYFAGIRHVQMEGSFGPPVDVAAPLRGLCARGLARMGHPDALMECVTLLTDPQVAARAGAIRAIAEAGRPEGVLLLRLKASVGDPEDEILGDRNRLLHRPFMPQRRAEDEHAPPSVPVGWEPDRRRPVIRCPCGPGEGAG